MKSIALFILFASSLFAAPLTACAEPAPELASMDAGAPSPSHSLGAPTASELSQRNSHMEITNTQARALRLPPARAGAVAPPSSMLIPGLNTLPDSYWQQVLAQSKSVQRWVALGWLRPGKHLPDLRTATTNPDGGPNPIKDGTVESLMAQREDEAKAAEAEASKVTSYPTSRGKSKT